VLDVIPLCSCIAHHCVIVVVVALLLFSSVWVINCVYLDVSTLGCLGSLNRENVSPSFPFHVSCVEEMPRRDVTSITPLATPFLFLSLFL